MESAQGLTPRRSISRGTEHGQDLFQAVYYTGLLEGVLAMFFVGEQVLR